MRREIERLLDIRAYDIYGLSEIAGPGVSYDCELQNGLHVCEDYFYPEVIDPDTLEPLPDGGVRRAGLYLYRKGGSASDPLPHAGHLRPLPRALRLRADNGADDQAPRPQRRHAHYPGVNVFLSQVEHVLLELGMDPNYLILVDRKNNLDTMEVQVEMNAALFSDTVRDLESTEKRIEGALQSTLNVHARVRLMEPGSLPRSEGKAKRVIDNRKL